MIKSIFDIYPNLPPLGTQATYSWRRHPVTITGYSLKTELDDGEPETWLMIQCVNTHHDEQWHCSNEVSVIGADGECLIENAIA